MAKPLFDFSQLSVAERVELALALWDSLPDDSVEPPLTDSERAELIRRLDAYKSNREGGSDWFEVRARIQERSPKKRER